VLIDVSRYTIILLILLKTYKEKGLNFNIFKKGRFVCEITKFFDCIVFYFNHQYFCTVKHQSIPPMWVNKDNNKINHIVAQLNWAITLVVIVVVIISHQYGG